MKIAGISSNKLGNDNYEGYLQNKNLYNDKELIDDADFNWYDYGFRNYDAQIGRFPQLDPLTDDYPELTPFQYASNEPIANVDLDGLEALPAVTVTTYISKSAATQGANLTSAGLRAALTASNAGVRIGLDGVNANTSQFRLVKDGQFHSSSTKSYRESPSWNLFEKMVDDEINKSWFSQGSNISINSITGQIRYSTTSAKMIDPVGIALLPLPKFGWATRFLGRGGNTAAMEAVDAVEQVAVHGNSLKSLRPIWSYKLYSNDGTFLKNGITSRAVPESRYTKAFMSDKYMVPVKQFPNRLEAWQWEFQQNQILRGPLNLNMQ